VIIIQLINDVNQATTLTSHLHRDLARAQILPKQSKRKKSRSSKNLLSSGLQIVLPHCNFRRTKVIFFIIIGEQSSISKQISKARQTVDQNRKQARELNWKKPEQKRLREQSFAEDCLVLSKNAKK
jgi:hypothetical protein